MGILLKLFSLGISGYVLSVLRLFLSNRPQYVVVDVCQSKPVNMVSEVPRAMFGSYIHRGAFLQTGE